MATVEQIDKKMEQLKNQKQAIISREKEKERKERTRKLIQIGGLFEKFFPNKTLEEIEDMFKVISQQSSN